MDLVKSNLCSTTTTQVWSEVKTCNFKPEDRTVSIPTPPLNSIRRVLNDGDHVL